MPLKPFLGSDARAVLFLGALVASIVLASMLALPYFGFDPISVSARRLVAARHPIGLAVAGGIVAFLAIDLIWMGLR